MAGGFTAPVALVSPDDGSGRLFIVDQIGIIHTLTAEGIVSEEPFLDLRHRIVSLKPAYDERGLLGLAFHPNFKENGRLFVYYSGPLRPEAPDDWDHTNYLSEFALIAEDPNQADPDSERVLLALDTPGDTHNGGQIVFGPDGYLYVGLGDGGSTGDQGPGHPTIGHGQDTSTLLGSLLRLDVDDGEPYGIPNDNPFVGREGLDEIFAYGLRNPYRFSFDAEGNHDLFVADVGENLFEEVNHVTAGGNYGWNLREGRHCFDPSQPTEPPVNCASSGLAGERLIDPVVEFDHQLGKAVIGGFVYRGSALPQLSGRYVFGTWKTLEPEPNGILLVAGAPQTSGAAWSIEELPTSANPEGPLPYFVIGFGQDAQRELYLLATQRWGPSDETGLVFKIVPGAAQ